MMNQGGNTETVAPADPNLLEVQHIVEASKLQASSYLHPATGSDATSWTSYRVDGASVANGFHLNSSYQYNQQAHTPTRNAQNGLGASSVACSSSSYVTSNAPQDYRGYASYPNTTSSYPNSTASYPNSSAPYPNSTGSYPNSTASYGYASTGYQGYYNTYQHQPNHSYTQPVGAYQNTGAPYQPISSFQNTGFYAGSSSYSTTYYNPGDYQTAGAYPNGGYSNQTTSNDGAYANYSSNQYANYTSNSNSSSAYSSGSATATSLHYEQHYKQWADYYSQTEVSCAPGTEKLSVANTPNLGSSVPDSTAGYPASSNQPQPSFAPSWRPESSSSELAPVQPGGVTGSSHDAYWKSGALNSQVHHTNITQPHYQMPLDLKNSYDSFQDQQQNVSPKGINLQNHTAYQGPQSYQSSSDNIPSLDTRRVLQIPTNPRIASSLSLGLPKTNLEGSATSVAAKPAYISVSHSLPKPNDKTLSNDTVDSLLKPGMFPKSLRGYVERALARCKDEIQMAACQSILKEMITKATTDGTLYTKDWDTEPIFQLPNADSLNKDNLQSSPPVSSLSKYKRSPSRRFKSRWEPLPDEKLAESPASVGNDTAKPGDWAHINQRDKKPLMVNSESNDLSTSRFPLWEQKAVSKVVHRPFKKQRLADGLNATGNGDASSDSDKEQSLTAYYSGAVALANSPEERKRRENRSKRFEKVHGHRLQNNHSKFKNTGAGNSYTRRASAMIISRSLEDSGCRAVEDIDWDSLTVKGTCQEIEKRYLRLTSAPDPASVRPEEVLEKALLMVQNSEKNYLFKCDQLKSIRQDLTVQRIRNQLTVKVYETHARIALEVGDLPEFNQCQSQLKTLYGEGIEGCYMEFAAYNLLCAIMHSNNNRELLSLMSRLSRQSKKDEAVKHALAVRAAVTSGNYVMFFRLYKTAPNLNSCLMDPYVEKMRYKAVNCISRSYRPTVSVSYIVQVLGFTGITPSSEGTDKKDLDGLDDCIEWLKAHGAFLITDNNGEMLLDTKASSSSLYMPEPEDAVAHGDANLAVNDFLTRTHL